MLLLVVEVEQKTGALVEKRELGVAEGYVLVRASEAKRRQPRDQAKQDMGDACPSQQQPGVALASELHRLRVEHRSIVGRTTGELA